QSSLAAAPSVSIPTVDLASEENQHPVMCNMDDGTDCTLVSNQEYAALTGAPARLGLKVVGSVHEDVEDPKVGSPPNDPAHVQLFERYGMAWLEYWVGGDCSVAGYLGGPDAAADQAAGAITMFPGGTRVPGCSAAARAGG